MQAIVRHVTFGASKFAAVELDQPLFSASDAIALEAEKTRQGCTGVMAQARVSGMKSGELPPEGPLTVMFDSRVPQLRTFTGRNGKTLGITYWVTPVK